MEKKRKRYDLNGRKYTDKMRKHLEAVRPKYGEKGFINLSGRPTKEAMVKAYREANPEATKRQCRKDLKLDAKTVCKWWN